MVTQPGAGPRACSPLTPRNRQLGFLRLVIMRPPPPLAGGLSLGLYIDIRRMTCMQCLQTLVECIMRGAARTFAARFHAHGAAGSGSEAKFCRLPGCGRIGANARSAPHLPARPLCAGTSRQCSPRGYGGARRPGLLARTTPHVARSTCMARASLSTLLCVRALRSWPAHSILEALLKLPPFDMFCITPSFPKCTAQRGSHEWEVLCMLHL